MFKFFKKTQQKQTAKPKTNRVIYMSNHISKYDLTYLHKELPLNVHFFVFNEDEYKINEKNLIGRKITLFDTFTAETLKKMISIIETEEPVMIFPEMRIARLGKVMKIYEEIGLLANRTEATIYPVCIQTKDEKGTAISISTLNPFTERSAHVHIGFPFQIDVENAKEISPKQYAASVIYRHLTNLYVRTKTPNRIPIATM